MYNKVRLTMPKQILFRHIKKEHPPIKRYEVVFIGTVNKGVFGTLYNTPLVNDIT